MNEPLRATHGADRPHSLPIGQLLVEAGRMRVEDIDQVRAHQSTNSTRFGESAVALGLVTQDHLREILAEQLASPILHPLAAELSPELVCAVSPHGPVAESIRSLRTALVLQQERTTGPLVLAVVGAARGEGRTFVTANLAVAFAQIGARTLVVDADLRHGRLHEPFRVNDNQGLARILIGRADVKDALPIVSHTMLAVMPGGKAPNPQDLLSTVRFRALVNAMGRRNDVVLFDTPALESSSDAQLVAAAAGRAVFLAELHAARKDSVKAMIRNLTSAGVSLVGAAIARR